MGGLKWHEKQFQSKRANTRGSNGRHRHYVGYSYHHL